MNDRTGQIWLDTMLDGSLVRVVLITNSNKIGIRYQHNVSMLYEDTSLLQELGPYLYEYHIPMEAWDSMTRVV
jgi:hypothetical protein